MCLKDIDKEQIKLLYLEKNYSCRNIAIKFNISYGSVYNILKDLGINRTSKEAHKNVCGKKQQNRSSKFYGVSRDKSGWIVQIVKNKKKLYSKFFKIEVEAAKDYDKAILNLGLDKLGYKINFPKKGD